MCFSWFSVFLVFLFPVGCSTFPRVCCWWFGVLVVFFLFFLFLFHFPITCPVLPCLSTCTSLASLLPLAVLCLVLGFLGSLLLGWLLHFAAFWGWVAAARFLILLFGQFGSWGELAPLRLSIVVVDICRRSSAGCVSLLPRGVFESTAFLLYAIAFAIPHCGPPLRSLLRVFSPVFSFSLNSGFCWLRPFNYFYSLFRG